MKVSYTLQGIDFEWDSEKAVANAQKHGVTFETACEAFFDPFLQQDDDDDIIDAELRERIIGMTQGWQLLYVVYTLRDDCIRVISARTASRQQKKDYETQ